MRGRSSRDPVPDEYGRTADASRAERRQRAIQRAGVAQAVLIQPATARRQRMMMQQQQV
jgi:hypothetical protein